MEHAPGPWVFREDSQAVYTERGPIADLSDSGWDLGTKFANGRLSAAAPELYDAAKIALKYLIGQNNIKTIDIERQLGSAIAKAEGRMI